MRNPFEFGSLVNNGAFCNRSQELADLLAHMKNGTNVFLYGERRMGKTSLAKIALAQLSGREFLKVYVDLWPTEDEQGFSSLYAKALAEAFNSKIETMLDWAKKTFPALTPTITINDHGQPEFSIGVSGRKSPRALLKTILAIPHAEAMKRKMHMVVVFDEFQQMLLYDDDFAVRQLRSSIQEHRDVSYVFLGSRKHLIQAMLQDKKEPLYGSGAHYLLGPIKENHWIDFVVKKFAETSKQIDVERVKNIYQQTEGHPFYTQQLCYLIWELTEENAAAQPDTLQRAIDNLLQRQRYSYETLWESITEKQRRLLEGIAFDGGKHIYSLDFLNQYGLQRASTAQAGVARLLEKDILDHDHGSYFITDRFFRLWICRTHGFRRNHETD